MHIKDVLTPNEHISFISNCFATSLRKFHVFSKNDEIISLYASQTFATLIGKIKEKTFLKKHGKKIHLLNAPKANPLSNPQKFQKD